MGSGGLGWINLSRVQIAGAIGTSHSELVPPIVKRGTSIRRRAELEVIGVFDTKA